MSKRSKQFLACALSMSMAMPFIQATTLFAAEVKTGDTAYGKYGNIKVVTTKTKVSGKEVTLRKLCDEKGNAIQLKGMSTFGLQWEEGQWVLNEAAFDALAKDWQCDVVRLAMYVAEDGYKTKPQEMLDKVEKGIKLATDRGMYVIVDWHVLSPGDPMDETYLSAGEDLPAYKEIKEKYPEYRGPQLFFAYLSQKYGDQGNVLFETANEPNGLGSEDKASDTWKEKLLPYHQSVVDAIRTYDKDKNPNIVICGTDNWSQFVDAPINHPVIDLDEENPQIMYTMHFYAGTHDTKADEKGNYWLGSKVEKALNNGLAVFCTEWGTSEATGDGGPYIDYTQRWLDFLEKNDISWCSWSLTRKSEISAAMLPTTPIKPTDHNKDGVPDWTKDELSITGNFVRAMIREEEAPMYGASETVVDFEDGKSHAIVLDDSPISAADYPLEVKTVSDNDMLYLPKTPDSVDNPWNGPRVSFQDLGTYYSLYKDLVFDVYVDDAKALKDDKLEIQPVIQTEARSWWAQLDPVTVTTKDFVKDEMAGKLKATVKVSVGEAPAGDKLGHVTLIMGATNGLYLDNIGFETNYNGDISKAPKVPDEPGTFVAVPFTFESGQREGWKKDGDSKVDYTKITVEELLKGDQALSFPMTFEPGKNEWEDGARLTSAMSIFELEDCKKYQAITMDVYLEAGKATTGKLQLEVCSIPNGDGYWYQSGGMAIDPLKGKEVVAADGRKLMKYEVCINLNKDNPGEYPFSDNVAIRNIILVLHNQDSDYNGQVYYDNIGYKTEAELSIPNAK